MAGRRTNLALLGLTILAFVTGLVAFTLGTSWGRVLVVAHTVLGLSALVLVPGKAGIARKGLRRNSTGRGLSLALAAVAVVTVATGILQVVGVTRAIGPFSTMQAHVTSGVVMVILSFVHMRMRRQRPRFADLDRRNVIRAAGLLGVAGALYAATEATWAVLDVPGSRRRFTGSHEIIDMSRVPATQWLNDSVPDVDESHVVDIAGVLVDVEEIGDHGDIVAAVLDCTGGWHTTQEWSGARLDRLIHDLSGESLVVRSVTGYWRRFPLDQADVLYLATRVAGTPLRRGHGAPVRLVAPGRRGFWWVKWVESVEVDHLPPWWQPPLPMA